MLVPFCTGLAQVFRSGGVATLLESFETARTSSLTYLASCLLPFSDISFDRATKYDQAPTIYDRGNEGLRMQHELDPKVATGFSHCFSQPGLS